MKHSASRVQGLKLVLVGNPNCGKTTLFNAVTGQAKEVGNWSGVTVEHQVGQFTFSHHSFKVADLPGIYSLLSHPECSEDEIAATKFLQQSDYDIIVNVIDANHFSQNLYLTLQLLALGKPVIVVLNRIDMAEQKGVHICPLQLSQLLGCPVVPIVASKLIGIEALLRQSLLKSKPATAIELTLPPQVEAAAKKIICENKSITYNQALSYLEGDYSKDNKLRVDVEKLQQSIHTDCNEEADIIIAKARHKVIDNIIAKAIKRREVKVPKTRQITNILDKACCDRWLGLPIFLGMMYLLFFISINIGGAIQSGFEIFFEGLLVEKVATTAHYMGMPDWLGNVLTQGVGRGICTVLTFVPVLFFMFLALTFLEESGYMARGAYVIDRLMRLIGLPGKSFVPMIIGFGCNVPAVLSTRALEYRRERILTIMMSPFMSCGARLAIFTVFVAAFYPEGGENIIFTLYIVGILMAIITGLVLKGTLLKGRSSPFILDIPDYSLPSMGHLLRIAWRKVYKFVKNAIRLVVPICAVIALLNSIMINNIDEPPQSVLSVVGEAITPIFAPMGMQQENWPASVGLITGVAAKEVVIGTINTLYTPDAENLLIAQTEDVDIIATFYAALDAIKSNFQHMLLEWKNPIGAKVAPIEVEDGTYYEMNKRFGGQVEAFAYLLFVLLYVPCMSVTAAMLKEINLKWTMFSVFWTTYLAYGIATLYYQMATFVFHPISSCLWLFGLAISTIMIIWAIKHYSYARLQLVPTSICVKT